MPLAEGAEVGGGLLLGLLLLLSAAGVAASSVSLSGSGVSRVVSRARSAATSNRVGSWQIRPSSLVKTQHSR